MNVFLTTIPSARRISTPLSSVSQHRIFFARYVEGEPESSPRGNPVAEKKKMRKKKNVKKKRKKTTGSRD